MAVLHSTKKTHNRFINTEDGVFFCPVTNPIKSADADRFRNRRERRAKLRQFRAARLAVRTAERDLFLAIDAAKRSQTAAVGRDVTPPAV